MNYKVEKTCQMLAWAEILSKLSDSNVQNFLHFWSTQEVLLEVRNAQISPLFELSKHYAKLGAEECEKRGICAI